MMKIVPARRFVRDASWLPPRNLPSIDRSRAVAPAGEAVADWVSITATVEIPEDAARRGNHPIYQPFVKNWSPASARRTPGPLTNKAELSAEDRLPCAFSHGRGIWVPAFAGTTARLIPD